MNSSNTPPPTALKRELGVYGATLLGLGSILGTGVFVSIGIAAGIAGPAVLLSIALAAVLASCNALSSAQLAAAHPVSGGTYEYGYRLLHPSLGFTAGWLFLCAKSASAATAALGAAGYALHLTGHDPAPIMRWAGLLIALSLLGLALSGLKRSNAINVVIVSITVAALTAFIVAGLLTNNTADTMEDFTPFFTDAADGGTRAILSATALMFVAYTGYGRIATMGEEVRAPRRTVPRAIIATLIVSALLYIGVGIAAIGLVGADGLSGNVGTAATPLEFAARAMRVPGLAFFVALGAVTAMLGVLLNLILGLSRVALAMGRRGDLPPAIGRLMPGQSPRAAILLVGIIIAALTLIGDVKTTWSVSAFTVLIYYALTNLAALRLPKPARLYPPIIPWAGLCGCVGIAFFLPIKIWVTGLTIIVTGLLWHIIAKRLWRRDSA